MHHTMILPFGFLRMRTPIRPFVCDCEDCSLDVAVLARSWNVRQRQLQNAARCVANLRMAGVGGVALQLAEAAVERLSSDLTGIAQALDRAVAQ